VIEILRPVCPIAWIPFAIAVFKITTLPEFLGLGYTRTIFDHLQLGMIFVIFWGAFFPILINTLDGVAGVRRDYIKLARMLGAGKLQLLTNVAIPAAFPMILTGLRQGVGLSWFVIIAAEMLPGSEIGIGYLLMYAADQSAMNIVLASIIIIGAIGASFNFLMIFISRKFIRWHGEEI
jgi:NitT/TauT family transport system permease protein